MIAIALLLTCALARNPQDTPRNETTNAAATLVTEHDVARGRVAVYQSAMLEDLRARSNESPPDPTVEELVRTYAEYLARWQYQQSDRQHRLMLLGRRALHYGHEDPLVLLATGDAAFMRSRFDEAAPMLDRAVDELTRNSRSPLVKHLAWTRSLALARHRGPADEVTRAAAKAEQYLIEAGADPAFAGDGANAYLRVIDNYRAIHPLSEDFLARLGDIEHAHRYPLLVLRAESEVELAWEARGSATADEVTEEGWRAFREHLATAERLAEEAAQLAPQFPEAPTVMIRVAGGTSAGQKVLRRWFDRARAARFDHTPAYEAYARFSLPRWGGSHAEMLRFAEECLASGHFDTRTPEMFRAVIATMLEDFADPTELLSEERVQRGLDAVHRGYSAHRQSAPWRRLLLSEHVVLLAASDRTPEAARLSQSIAGGFYDGALLRYGVDRAWLDERLAPHLLPHALEEVASFDVYEGFETEIPEDSPAARPIRGNDQSSTRAVDLSGLGQWLGEVLRAESSARGRRDPRWDALASDLFDGIGTSLGDAMELPDARLRSQARSLLDLDCGDPVARFAAAVAIGPEDPDRALAVLAACLGEHEKSPFSPVVTFLILRSFETELRAAGRSDGADRLARQAAEVAVAMASEPRFSGVNARHYIELVIPSFDIGWGIGRLSDAQVDEIGAQETAALWIREMIVGLRHSARAARGPIDPWPTSDRLRHYHHLSEAERHLRAAHALHPEWPEAAAAMIVVAMLEPGELAPRDWFDRAVAATFDYEPAYRNLAWSLRPEWGGSVRAMYRFAVACLDTGRFETFAPRWYARTIEHLDELLDDPRWAWSAPHVGRRMAELAEGTSNAGQNRWMVDDLNGARLVSDWAGGRFDQALQLWRAAGRRLNHNWLTFLNIDRARIEADLRALDRRER